MGKRRNQEDVINELKLIHKYDNYDYSKFVYNGSNTKACIICPKHGEFWQTPHAHMSGQGCPICGREKLIKSMSKSYSQFEDEVNKIHNGRYKYNHDYVNRNTKIKIFCKEHGWFYQLPYAHLNGCGCPKCNGKNKTTEEFIIEAQNVHQNEPYDYSYTMYKGIKQKVCIICTKHGEFWQTAEKHLKGQGCPICGRDKLAKKNTKDIEVFESEAKQIHKGLYKYCSDYVSATKKVKIICPKHGVFMQRPSDHLNGQGCPYCKTSHIELEIKNLLLEKEIEFEYQKKFAWLGLQSLDFYLLKYNIAIECQGQQHFRPVDIFGGMKSFERIKWLDGRKYNLCIENGVKLIYYANYEYDFPYEVITDKEKLLKIIKIEQTDI